MSIAALEASALKTLLDARASNSNPLDGLASAFFVVIQDLLLAPWAVAEDDFMYEKTRGKRPADLAQRMRFRSALMQVASEDAAVHQLMVEVNHLVSSPDALRGPELVSRIASRMI